MLFHILGTDWMSTNSIGQKIQDFSLPATGSQTISAQQFAGKNVIIYFYPRDNTPGCTLEGKEFRDHINEFEQLNTVIYGVSQDSLRKHENFKKKCEFPFELICDEEDILCQQFDVIKLKKLYGKEYMGIERSTFFIDTNGVLIKEWRKVKVKGHVDEVLEFTKSQ